MKRSTWISLLALAIAIASTPPARCGEVGSDSAGIRAHTEQGIRYVTGGIGGDHRQSMASIGKDYNVKLVFAEAAQQNQRHPLVASVALRIVDEAGREVLAVQDVGPWLLASLPPGTYQVTATLRGGSSQKTVTVEPGRRAQLAFYW